MASKFPSLSGYHYAYNSPVMYNDPLGAQGEPGNPWFGGGYRWMENMGPPPSAYNSMGASTFGSTMDNYWYQAMNGNGWAEQTMYKNGLASRARAGDMDALREYAARYGGGLKIVEVWHSTAQAGGETYYHYEIVMGEGNAQNGGIDAGPFTGSMADGSTYFEGVRVYTTEAGAIGHGAAGTLPGIGIFVNPNAKYNVNLLRHEFGHILQARKWGNDFFYGTIVPVSLMSSDAANNGSFDHQSTWTEWTANLLSWRYFGKPADWDMNSYPIFPTQPSGMLAYPPKSINLK